MKRPLYGLGITGLFILLAACDPVADCNDAGGRWVEELQECECTYEDRGNYDIHITEEEYAKCRKAVPLEADAPENQSE